MLRDADQAARALRTRFEPGERVAIWAPNIPEWVVLEFALAMAGLTLVTVNPAYRPSELHYVLDHSGASGIFLVPEFRSPMAAYLDEVRADLPQLRESVLFTDWQEFLDSAPLKVAHHTKQLHRRSPSSRAKRNSEVPLPRRAARTPG